MNTFKRPTLLVRFRYLHFFYPSHYRKQSSTYSQRGAPLEDCIIPNTDLKGKNPPFLSLCIPRRHDQYLVQPRRRGSTHSFMWGQYLLSHTCKYHVAQKTSTNIFQKNKMLWSQNTENLSWAISRPCSLPVFTRMCPVLNTSFDLGKNSTHTVVDNRTHWAFWQRTAWKHWLAPKGILNVQDDVLKGSYTFTSGFLKNFLYASAADSCISQRLNCSLQHIQHVNFLNF